MEYRSLKFDTTIIGTSNFQGNAVVNYTDGAIPWTRIIEYKWFTFGRNMNGVESPNTVTSKEFSSEWKPGEEPYYPVNDEKIIAYTKKYKKLSKKKNDWYLGVFGKTFLSSPPFGQLNIH